MERSDPAELYRRFGSSLRQARGTAGMSQERLAEKVGMTRTSISNLEAGRQRPPLHIVYDLASVLGLPPAELLPDLLVEPEEREGLLQEVDEPQRDWVRRVMTKVDAKDGG